MSTCRKLWPTRIMRRPPRYAMKSSNSKTSSRNRYENLQHVGHCRRMVARGGAPSPDRDQQSGTARTQLAQPSFSWLGEKGGAQFHPGINQIARGNASGNAGGIAESLQDLSALDRQVLVERHLISREHAAKGAGSAVVVNRRQTLSIMINEEDHLRMQSIRSGLQLKQAFKLVDKIDTALEGKLDFAFDPRLGYLTACPTNVGTGMRASAMLHLPGDRK